MSERDVVNALRDLVGLTLAHPANLFQANTSQFLDRSGIGLALVLIGGGRVG